MWSERVKWMTDTIHSLDWVITQSCHVAVQFTPPGSRLIQSVPSLAVRNENLVQSGHRRQTFRELASFRFWSLAACKSLQTSVHRRWRDALLFASTVTCLRTLLHLSVGCPGSALSTTPDLCNRVLNKHLIDWVSCLAWWERWLFLSVYRRRPLSLSQSCILCIVYRRTMSYNCAPNIGLLGLYSSGQHAAPLRSWKSFVVCGKASLNSFFAHSAAFFLDLWESVKSQFAEEQANWNVVCWNVFTWGK